jgi:pimeloyl-ACP methyl ester carboxylesterase
VEREVRLWCGMEDMICPVVCSRKVAAHLGNGRLVEVEGETHYTIVVKKSEEILRELLKE